MPILNWYGPRSKIEAARHFCTFVSTNTFTISVFIRSYVQTIEHPRVTRDWCKVYCKFVSRPRNWHFYGHSVISAASGRRLLSYTSAKTAQSALLATKKCFGKGIWPSFCTSPTTLAVKCWTPASHSRFVQGSFARTDEPFRDSRISKV